MSIKLTTKPTKLQILKSGGCPLTWWMGCRSYETVSINNVNRWNCFAEVYIKGELGSCNLMGYKLI